MAIGGGRNATPPTLPPQAQPPEASVMLGLRGLGSLEGHGMERFDSDLIGLHTKLNVSIRRSKKYWKTNREGNVCQSVCVYVGTEACRHACSLLGECRHV